MTIRTRMMRGVLVVGLLGASAAGGFVAQHRDSHASAGSTTPAGYVTLTPSRILDTRPDSRVGYYGTIPAAGQIIKVPAVPGAAAVAVNLTMTQTAGPGFLAAWDGIGARPNVSIINSTTAGENIANFAIVPVAADGSFSLFTYAGTHIVVDLMGYFPAGAAPAANALAGTLTGYGPGSSYTTVSGIVTNGTSLKRSVRVDVTCPNGTVENDYAFGLESGATQGWSVLCTGGAFTTGASILQIVDT